MRDCVRLAPSCDSVSLTADIPQVVNLFGDSKHPGMAYHNRPEEDPYITVHEDSDSEQDDFVLRGTDRLILAARNEDDVSHLEVGPESYVHPFHKTYCPLHHSCVMERVADA